MAEIQYYPEELDYVHLKMDENPNSSSFLEHFLTACLHADNENYEILRPALQQIMKKYPVQVYVELSEDLKKAILDSPPRPGRIVTKED